MCEGLVDKVRPLLKEGTQVELLGVVGLDTVVRDARAGVEIHAGVDVHEGGSLRHVEDVCHPELLQTHCILGHEAGGGGMERRNNHFSFNRVGGPAESLQRASDGEMKLLSALFIIKRFLMSKTLYLHVVSHLLLKATSLIPIFIIRNCI